MTVLRTDRKHASNCMTEENGVEKVKKRKKECPIQQVFLEVEKPWEVERPEISFWESCRGLL